MKIFKFNFPALTFLFAAFALPSILSAEPIDYFTGATVGTAASQFGRLSRNNIQQTWTGSEPYPGVINTTTKYYYTTYTYSSSLFTGAPYVEITATDELDAGTFFVSAYENSYDSTNPAANWLGDEGASGNYFGPTDPRYFDVVLPVGDSLVLVVNNTLAAGGGTNAPFDISVNAYADTSYDDPAPAVVPEPSTLVMLGTGLAGVAAAARRRMGLRR